MKEQIYNLIKDYGHVSFVELQNRIEGFSGNLEIVSSENKNIVLWSGISDNGIEAMSVLMKEEKTKAVNTSPLLYMADGAMLKLPIVKGNHQYKKPHWLPVVFCLG